ncbi:uncharacterized protein L203_104096 [Cryptococcus depauperatus CBS 7841]|uniref:Uncharacterized protein n=1 Tax=Cryptococcus depauperatus CBS 7841 TaxID=1295531 RepID=A0AAJ8JUT4_9TREE
MLRTKRLQSKSSAEPLSSTSTSTVITTPATTPAFSERETLLRRTPRKFFTSPTLALPPSASKLTPVKGLSPAPTVSMDKVLEALNMEGSTERAEGRALKKRLEGANTDDDKDIPNGDKVGRKKARIKVVEAVVVNGRSRAATSRMVSRSEPTRERNSMGNRSTQYLPSSPLNTESDKEHFANLASPTKFEKGKLITKEYMTSGLYCQFNDPKSEEMLVNRVLKIREEEQAAKRLTQMKKAKGGRVRPRTSIPSRRSARNTRARNNAANDEGARVKQDKKLRDGTSPLKVDRPTFPPLPYDFGYNYFFGQEHDFELPFDIRMNGRSGLLNDKKKPTHFQKICSDVYSERSRIVTDIEQYANAALRQNVKKRASAEIYATSMARIIHVETHNILFGFERVRYPKSCLIKILNTLLLKRMTDTSNVHAVPPIIVVISDTNSCALKKVAKEIFSEQAPILKAATAQEFTKTFIEKQGRSSKHTIIIFR